MKFYRLDGSSNTVISWLDINIEPSISTSFMNAVINTVEFNTCIVLDSFLNSQRAGFSVPSSQLFCISSSSFEHSFTNIPQLPSPNYITGLGAEIMTYVIYSILYNE